MHKDNSSGINALYNADPIAADRIVRGMETSASILQYRADNYGQKSATRCPGPAAELLPPNPYPVAN